MLLWLCLKNSELNKTVVVEVKTVVLIYTCTGFNILFPFFSFVMFLKHKIIVFGGRCMVGVVDTVSVLYSIVSRIYGVIKASVWQAA